MSAEFLHCLERCNRTLSDFVHARVRQPADGDDVIQDVIVIAMRRWQTLRDHDKALHWFIAIARNELKRYYKQISRSVCLDVNDIENLLGQHTEISPVPIMIDEFLSTLPRGWAMAVILHLEYGYSAPHVSRMFALASQQHPKTVQNRLYRIVRLLAEAVYVEDKGAANINVHERA